MELTSRAYERDLLRQGVKYIHTDALKEKKTIVAPKFDLKCLFYPPLSRNLARKALHLRVPSLCCIIFLSPLTSAHSRSYSERVALATLEHRFNSVNIQI